MEFKKISLLTQEQFEKHNKNISLLPHWWWLRSPCFDRYAPFIDYDGSFHHTLAINDYGYIRPALYTHKTTVLNIGDCYTFGKKHWTAISRHILLCDNSINQMEFGVTGCYSQSSIKIYLKLWAEERNIMITKPEQ